VAGTCGKAGGEHPHLEHGSTAAPAGRRAVKMASSKAVLSQEIGWYTIDAQVLRCTVSNCRTVLVRPLPRESSERSLTRMLGLDSTCFRCFFARCPSSGQPMGQPIMRPAQPARSQAQQPARSFASATPTSPEQARQRAPHGRAARRSGQRALPPPTTWRRYRHRQRAGNVDRPVLAQVGHLALCGLLRRTAITRHQRLPRQPAHSA
jgi:hypothetical protein